MKHNSISAQAFHRLLQNSKHATLKISYPNGEVHSYGEGLPLIRVEIKTWDTLSHLLKRGDIGFAEAIIDGTLWVDNTAALVEWACRNESDLREALYGRWYGLIVAKLHHLMNANSKSGAKRNIMAHYDLGNEFYRLWLDPSMTYSSAIFHSQEQPLAEAQMAKYDRIIDTLDIRPGDRVLEIGCGWGGFFRRAVERTGCHVTAVLNSPNQAQHNLERIKEAGLQDHVDLRQMDYRDIEGQFDKVVSIEMIEAVGEKYWNQFFGKVSASLKNRGSALIQGITIREDLFDAYRKGTDFIQQYVFPGGMLLTNTAFQRQSSRAGMKLAEKYEFPISYADTLATWRVNFRKALPNVHQLGFDDRFVRLWELYLSYCEGAFRAERTSVGQYLIAK